MKSPNQIFDCGLKILFVLLLMAIPSYSSAQLSAPATSGLALPKLPPLKLKQLGYVPPSVQKYDFVPRLIDPRQNPQHPLLFVIHETAVSKNQALRMLRSPAYPASYHAMIDRDGSILLIIPRSHTSYAAGRSRFNAEISEHTRHDPYFEPWKIPYKPSRDEAILTERGVPSVNHFGYQVELISPPDGYWCSDSPVNANPLKCVDYRPGQGKTHSGYTDLQYQSLVWLALQMDIDPKRITTHKAVELARHHSHTDPRSFDWQQFWRLYEILKPEINIMNEYSE